MKLKIEVKLTASKPLLIALAALAGASDKIFSQEPEGLTEAVKETDVTALRESVKVVAEEVQPVKKRTRSTTAKVESAQETSEAPNDKQIAEEAPAPEAQEESSEEQAAGPQGIGVDPNLTEVELRALVRQHITSEDKKQAAKKKLTELGADNVAHLATLSPDKRIAFANWLPTL